MRVQAKFALCLALVLPPQSKAAESAANATVLAAVQAAVESRGYAFPKGSCTTGLEMGEAIPRSRSAFVVAQIKYDPGLGQARFLLRSRTDPKAPPFYAWCTYQSDAAAKVQKQNNRVNFSADDEQSSLGPVLVDVRREARLYLHSENSAIVVTVRPLQCGHKDERIHVRLPLNGKTLQARVVGEDALEAAF